MPRFRHPRAPLAASAVTLIALACGGTSTADPIPPGRPAIAAPRFTLLLPNAAPEPIALLQLGPDETNDTASIITYLDASGTRKTASLNSVVALASATWMPTPESVSPPLGERPNDLHMQRLDLTDGQRIIGQLTDPPTAPTPTAAVSAKSPLQAAAPRVSIRTDRLGVITIPTDRVSRFFLDASRHAVPSGLSTSADTLLLINEDRIEGFIDTLGPMVRIEPNGGRAGAKPGVAEIQLDQIELANLINAPTPPTGGRVDLADGTVLAVDPGSLVANIESAKLAMRPAVLGSDAAPTSIDLNELSGIIPEASRLIPLSGLPIAAQRPHASAPRTSPAELLADAPAPLGAVDILLPGPMMIEWALPQRLGSGVAISGFAQMDDRSFAWGDCEVTVSVILPAAPARVLVKGRLNADSPTLPIVGELGATPPGSRVRVQVDPGERGPVQDRVVLRRMLLVAAAKSR